MYHMCDNVAGLMILGMEHTINSAEAQYCRAFQTLRYTNALGNASLSLPKLLDALGLLSREIFQAATSG